MARVRCCLLCCTHSMSMVIAAILMVIDWPTLCPTPSLQAPVQGGVNCPTPHCDKQKWTQYRTLQNVTVEWVDRIGQVVFCGKKISCSGGNTQLKPKTVNLDWSMIGLQCLMQTVVLTSTDNVTELNVMLYCWLGWCWAMRETQTCRTNCLEKPFDVRSWHATHCIEAQTSVLYHHCTVHVPRCLQTLCSRYLVRFTLKLWQIKVTTNNLKTHTP